jgi:carbon starvation protein
MNSIWLIIVALSAFAVAYRFYGAFLATKVAVLNNANETPAHKMRDGVDYHPTRKLVLFGHHFAAIAGAGPLIGPVLAAQWGYLPGFTWIIVGACLAGGVHDFVMLLASMRNDGKSLSCIARKDIGPVSGFTASCATLFIVIYVLAATSVVVVNALAESAWAMFTIIATIPAALITGLWMYKIRPGKVGQASFIGVFMVIIGVVLGKFFADSPMAHLLIFSRPTLSIILPAYTFIASVLPVWVLMCPRDYLSSYLKIGVIIALALVVILVRPHLFMPAMTPFVDGSGPIVSGKVLPFVCIVIMCGALSGFHALIASGTTPKMINKERDALPIGYGAMLTEGVVSVMALIAACSLHPGDYFAINCPQSTETNKAAYVQMIDTQASKQNWDIKPVEIEQLTKDTGEKTLVGRTGGAVTLAVGMSNVVGHIPGMKHLTAYWYHFVIMFEALFILTLLESGTRVGRFLFQETMAVIHPSFAVGIKVKWSVNITLSALTSLSWGFLLYIGNLNTLWKMMGVANQLLSVIALSIGTIFILNHSPKRVYALCTALPLVFILGIVSQASYISIVEWVKAGARAVTTTDVIQYHLLVIFGILMMILTYVTVLDAARKCYQILRLGPTRKDGATGADIRTKTAPDAVKA